MVSMLPALKFLRFLHKTNTVMSDDCRRKMESNVLVYGSRIAATGAKTKLSYKEFENDGVNTMVNVKADFKLWMTGRQCFCKYPFILDASFKSRVLRAESTLAMRQAFHSVYERAAHWPSRVHSLLSAARSARKHCTRYDAPDCCCVAESR